MVGRSRGPELEPVTQASHLPRQLFGVQPQLPPLSQVHVAPDPQSVGKAVMPESAPASPVAPASGGSEQRKVQKWVDRSPSDEQMWADEVLEQSVMDPQYCPTPSELPALHGCPHCESMGSHAVSAAAPASELEPPLDELLQATKTARETKTPTPARAKGRFMPPFSPGRPPDATVSASHCGTGGTTTWLIWCRLIPAGYA